MSYNVGTGEGNPNPQTYYETVKAGVAISKGQLVTISHSAADGYTVVLANSGAVATGKVFGVAKEAIASGSFGEVIVKGFCDYMVTDGGVTSGQALLSGGTAGAAHGAAITTANSYIFGQAMAADSGTVLTAAMIF